MGYIIAFILGIVISTIGFSGVAQMADRGVNLIKHEARTLPSDRN
jgi:amino acid transporter